MHVASLQVDPVLARTCQAPCALRRRKSAGVLVRWALAATLPLGLIACDGAEEREAAYFERGKSLYEAGDYSKASLELRNARQINPLNHEALYYLGLIAEKKGDFRGAYKAYQAVIEQAPKHVGGNLHAGRILLMSGEIDQASEKAKAALEVEPENVEARALRGAVSLRRDALEAARADAEFALGKDKHNVAATSVLVGVLQKENKPEEAIAVLREATAANKRETALRLLLIELHRRQKDADAIVGVYQELFEIDRKNIGYRTDLARYLVAFGRKDDGEKVLRKAVEEIPDNQQAKLVLIDFLANQRSMEQAEGALKNFIAEAPQNAELKFGLAQLYVKHSETEKAEATLREIEGTAESKTTVVRARTALARMRMGAGDKLAAKELADKVLAEDSANASALVIRSQLQLEDGERDEAIANLRRVLRDNPGNVDALKLVSQAHLQGGDLDLASENLRLLLNADPNNDEARLTLARIYVRQRNPEKAISLVDKVLERQPKQPMALRLRDEILIAQRKLAPAMENARKMLAVEGEEARGYVAMGRVYQVNGQHVEALEAYRKAYAEDPELMTALTGIVQSHLAMKQPDEAISLLHAVLKKAPKNVFAHNMLGEVYAFQKVADKAEAAFREATELRANWSLPYLNLSRLKVAESKPEEAISVLEEGLKNVPGDATLKLTLASAQQSSKDIDGALSTYRSLLDANPKLDVAANNLAALIADYKYSDPETLDDALGLAQRFQNSDNPFYLDTLGWLHYRKGDYSLAVVFISKALENRPEHPQLNFHLGMAYFKSGNTADARRYLEKAIELGKTDTALIDEAKSILATM